jgi:mxaC protein
VSWDLALASPWALVALPLALLPWISARAELPRYPWLALVPADRLSDALGLLLRCIGSLAIAAAVVGLAEPYRGPTTAIRSGEGAEIAILLDRSRSMDESFGERDGLHWSDTRRESKGRAARRLLSEFASQRAADVFAFIIFSSRPVPVLDFSSSPQAILAAIGAHDVGRGLGETDIGRALEAGAGLFEQRPYLGARVLLLVSDGGAHIDPQTRARLTALLKRERIVLYWLYIRSPRSKSLSGSHSQQAFDTAPELALHHFLLNSGVPYRAYEAEDPHALASAIEDINRLEKHPIYTTHIEPRREYAGECHMLALACSLALLAFRARERVQWKPS